MNEVPLRKDWQKQNYDALSDIIKTCNTCHRQGFLLVYDPRCSIKKCTFFVIFLVHQNFSYSDWLILNSWRFHCSLSEFLLGTTFYGNLNENLIKTTSGGMSNFFRYKTIFRILWTSIFTWTMSITITHGVIQSLKWVFPSSKKQTVLSSFVSSKMTNSGTVLWGMKEYTEG